MIRQNKTTSSDRESDCKSKHTTCSCSQGLASATSANVGQLLLEDQSNELGQPGYSETTCQSVVYFDNRDGDLCRIEGRDIDTAECESTTKRHQSLCLINFALSVLVFALWLIALSAAALFTWTSLGHPSHPMRRQLASSNANLQ